jgi:hypothetical protein
MNTDNKLSLIPQTIFTGESAIWTKLSRIAWARTRRRKIPEHAGRGLGELGRQPFETGLLKWLAFHLEAIDAQVL